MFGSSSGEPNWHQATAASPSKTRAACAFPLANETLLPGAAHLALRPAFSRMEPSAPAAAEPHAVVLLGESGEGIPRRCIERPNLILAHTPPFTGSRSTLAPVRWHARKLPPSGSSSSSRSTASSPFHPSRSSLVSPHSMQISRATRTSDRTTFRARGIGRVTTELSISPTAFRATGRSPRLRLVLDYRVTRPGEAGRPTG